MIGSLISFFTGGGFNSIADQFRQAYEAKLAAQNDAERIAADKWIAELEHRVAAQTQGAGTAWAKIMRAAFALPFVIYHGKLIIWDKVLGWGTTDPLSPYLEGIAWTIIAFYFLDNTIRMIRR